MRKLFLFTATIWLFLLPAMLQAAPRLGLGAGVGFSFGSSADFDHNDFNQYIGYLFHLGAHMKVLWGNYGAYTSYEYRGAREIIEITASDSRSSSIETYHRLIVGSDIAIPISKLLSVSITPGLVFLITDSIKDGVSTSYGIALPVGVRIAVNRHFHVGVELRLLEENFFDLQTPKAFADSGLMINLTFLFGKTSPAVASP